jgi:hypothetical protein
VAESKAQRDRPAQTVPDIPVDAVFESSINWADPDVQAALIEQVVAGQGFPIDQLRSVLETFAGLKKRVEELEQWKRERERADEQARWDVLESY